MNSRKRVPISVFFMQGSEKKMSTIYIVGGAGCGDPGLITVKGKEILDRADVLIYAGSLVNPELVDACPATEKYDSWGGMKLADMTDIMIAAAQSGKTVVRLHSGGDPHSTAPSSSRWISCTPQTLTSNAFPASHRSSGGRPRPLASSILSKGGCPNRSSSPGPPERHWTRTRSRNSRPSERRW